MEKTGKFVFTLALLLMTAYPVLGADLDPRFKKTYPGSEGAITFNHQLHAERLKDCAFCHNSLEAYGGTVNEEFGHKFCLTCHQTKEKAPTECKGCHKG